MRAGIVVGALCVLVAAFLGGAANAQPTDSNRKQLADSSARLAVAARSAEDDLAMLHAAGAGDPKSIPVYAGRVDGDLHQLIESEQHELEIMQNADVNDLVVVVMTQLAKDTQDDLRSYAQQVAQYNRTRKFSTDDLDFIDTIELNTQAVAFLADSLASESPPPPP